MAQQTQTEFKGQRRVDTNLDPNIALEFFIQQALNGVQTVSIVRVEAVSNAGELSPVGTVAVKPLVQQMTGEREAVDHGIIYNIPYFRIQGGTDAVIIDPKIGDIGICVFCSRDSSAVKATKKEAPPGSYRTFNWADGMYIGGFLNGVPEQYIRFSASGIEVVTSTNTIKAFVDIQGSAQTSANLSVGTGATGTFTTPSGQTVTVADGIIINIA